MDLLVFDDFLTQLRQQGFEIGVDHYLRLQELLNKTHAECAPQDLKTILCPIFVTSQAQQEQFHLFFDSYFRILRSAAQPMSQPELHADRVGLTDSKPKRTLYKKWLYIAGAIVAVVVGLLTLQVVRRNAKQTALDNSSQLPVPTQTRWSPANKPRISPSGEPKAAATPLVSTSDSKDFNARIYELAKRLFGFTALWFAALTPLLLYIFYYHPLQTNKPQSEIYRVIRPLLAWSIIVTQPLLWSALGDFNNLTSRANLAVWVPLITSCLFFLFFRSETPRFPPKNNNDILFRIHVGGLAVIVSLVLFFYGLTIHLMAVFSPLFFFFIYEWHRYRSRQLLLQRHRGKRPPFFWPIRMRTFVPKLFDSELFYQAARFMRLRQVDDRSELDLESSVAATIESLGRSTFRYKPRTRPPEYIVLIDRESFRDHQAQYFSELAKALTHEGIFVARFLYDGDPRICCEENSNACLTLAELHSRFANHRLLILGDGAKLLDPVTGSLAAWTSILTDWKDRALLTPISPTQWGYAEVSLARLFIVLPASLQSLLTLVTYFATLVEPDLRRWQNLGALQELPNLADEANIIAGLRSYLGESAFQWLCACAVYPELQWDLTLYIGSLPTMDRNLITEVSLLRLFRLRWFRTGTIPDEIRSLLLKELDPAKERDVRRAIVELLERDPAPRGSYAAEAYHLNLVVQRWLLKRARQEKRELVDTLQATRRHLRVQDYTLLRFLEAPPPSALNLYLPTRFRRAFYRNGIPAFGLRTGVRLLVILAIINIGIVFRNQRSFASRVTRQDTSASEKNIRQPGVPRAVVRTSNGHFVWVDDEGAILGEMRATDRMPAFFIRGWNEDSTELAKAENRERVGKYVELAQEWESAGLAERISEINLIDLQDIRVQLAGKDSDIDVRLGGNNLTNRLRAALDVLDEYRKSPRGASITYVEAKGDRIILGFTTGSRSANDFPNYAIFKHDSSNHASLACSSCHQRSSDNSITPLLPGHKACTGCHLVQFSQGSSALCTICHGEAIGRTPSVNAFPPLLTFDTTFDHKLHQNPPSRPASGCVTCHQLQGDKVVSTVRGLDAHNACYVCHTPQASSNGRDIAACGTCHASRTK